MRNTTTRLGPWIRRFLLEHLVHERNLARNTQRSYRDTLALLAPFASDHARVSVDRLAVEHLSPDLVRQFLHAITVTRDCSPATCNQRLAAIRAFARFVGRHSPEHIEWSGHICDIPFRKCAQAPVTYSRETGDRRPVGCARPEHATGSSRPRRPPVSLQHGRARR